MLESHDRAFKEWAVSCEALRSGRQTLLIRKGGIREESGVFEMNDREFFLLPTYEHQKPALLQDELLPRLAALQTHDWRTVSIGTYAVVDTILEARDDAQVNGVSDEHIWNADFVKMRFDFNPYDPLYLVILRVYRMPEPITLPMLPEYEGCKSWVTLERALPTMGCEPAIPDEEFARRRKSLSERLQA